MSQRRMFSPDIVESEEFLSMPISSQALYFHLGMHADDDGFVNPKPIMRLANIGDDDLKVLLAKRFILGFETGVVVIKHWLIHNMIRSDRYKPTRYIDEKKTLYIKENNAYTDNGCQIGNQMAAQVRLGKDSIGKDRDEIPLSYSEPLKETFNTKAKQFAKLGIPYTPKKKTSKQEQFLERSKLVDYFKEAVNQEHSKSYFTHPDDIKDIQKENSKIAKQLKDFFERCGSLEKSKEVIIWFASGYGEWCEYKPSGCFRKETAVDFENRKENGAETKKFIINK